MEIASFVFWMRVEKKAADFHYLPSFSEFIEYLLKL